MSRPGLPFVVVRWLDASVSAAGWEVPEESYELPVCYSTGFMKEFDGYVVVWSSGGTSYTDTKEEYNARITIPKVWIEDIKYPDWPFPLETPDHESETTTTSN